MMQTKFESAKGAIRRACVQEKDAAKAAQNLAEQLGAKELKALIFFCSSTYDLDVLGRAIESHFYCPVMGCTTAGEISAPDGYLTNSLVGIGFASSDISLTSIFIPSLTNFLAGEIPKWPTVSGMIRKHFGMLLIDGLSLLEERVTAQIYQQLGRIPLIGGSASDDLHFQKASVYHCGRFHSHAATVGIFKTRLPFRTFHFQHFIPTSAKLTITKADSKTRTVFEIDDLPAAIEYARIVGVPLETLSPSVFAAHPVMLSIGGEDYVRSIQKANSDGSLTFYCAVEPGTKLILAKSGHLAEHLDQQLSNLSQQMPDLQLIIGCDCILRRLEMEKFEEKERLEKVLANYPFVGFSTYGEQYSGIHVNQTLTGIAIGGNPDEQ